MYLKPFTVVANLEENTGTIRGICGILQCWDGPFLILSSESASDAPQIPRELEETSAGKGIVHALKRWGNTGNTYALANILQPSIIIFHHHN